MHALYEVIWLVLLVANIIGIYGLFGHVGLTWMFPEGKRYWHFPVQLSLLATFALLVIYHPFG